MACDNLNILYINIRSLRNKLDDLNHILLTSNKKIHIIVLTETWIYSNEKCYFNIPSYTSVHDCRDSRGGGTCIYVINGLNYVLNSKISVSLGDCNIISVYLPQQNLTIYGVYRPPKNNCKLFTTEIDKLLDNQKNSCIFIGDINLDLLNSSSATNDYKNVVEMNGFKFQNTINRLNATRTTKNTASILDHVITNKNIQCSMKLQDHQVSDHKIMYVEVKKVIYRNSKQILTKKIIDIAQWKQKMEKHLNENQISSFRELSDTINKMKNDCTREKSIKIRNNNQWVTKEYLIKLKQRDKLYVRWRRIQNEYTENEYKALKNEVNKLRINLQKKFTQKKLQEVQGDGRKTWKILNELCSRNIKKTKQINKIRKQNSDQCVDDAEMAEEMNNYFTSIGQILASKIHHRPGLTFREEEEHDTIELEETNIEEIRNIISGIKNNCAPGMDGITKKDIETLFHIIGPTVVRLSNCVLESGQYPEELKIAKIVPIHKKGAHDVINNYRPISLLSTFSKILEKVLKTRLIQFIERHFKFDRNQYGFQKHSGTLGATVDLLEHITSELEKNKYVICVFIDLQKAFDTVDIEIMLEKLEKMGFRGKCHDLLSSYSTGRKQCTTVNGLVSNEADVNVGVAQGSVLGPMEYLLYVQNLKYAGLSAEYVQFCDDTVLIFSGASKDELEQVVNNDLKQYSDWLCQNKLSLNVEKTVYMVINLPNKKKIEPVIKINKKTLEKVNNYKYLGLVINEKLTWTEHIQSILDKIAPILGAIKRCSHRLNKNSRYLLYNSFIEPHIRYLLPCYGNASAELLDKLQRLQNKSIKAIFSINFYTPSQNLYGEYPFLKVEHLKALEQAKLIYKIKNKLLKTNVELRLNCDIHNYNLRTRGNLRNKYARTRKAQESPIYRSVETYNVLPETLFVGGEKAVSRNLKRYLKSRD